MPARSRGPALRRCGIVLPLLAAAVFVNLSGKLMPSDPLPKGPKDLANRSDFQTHVLECAAEKGFRTGGETGAVLAF